MALISFDSSSTLICPVRCNCPVRVVLLAFEKRDILSLSLVSIGAKEYDAPIWYAM